MRHRSKRTYVALVGLLLTVVSGMASAAADGVTISNSQTVYTVPSGALSGDSNGINVTSTGSVAGIYIPNISQIIGTTNAGIYNAGSITDATTHRAIDNENSSSVIYGAVAGIYNASGATISSSTGLWSAIYNVGTIGKYGSLYSTYGIYNAGTIENSPTGSGLYYAIRNDTGGLITGSSAGIYNAATGVIRSTVSTAITNAASSTISSIVNLGSITGASTGDGIDNAGTINAITNSGTITASGTGYGIRNTGTITTLNNGQSTLTYNGTLPTNYNIIVNGLTNYGQLSGSSLGSSSTTFGIYSGSTLLKGTYASVLTGFTSGTNVSATSGTFNGTAWSLVLNNGTTWDLVVQSSATNTLASVQQNTGGLASLYNQQAAAYNAALTYDCSVYDENNLCVSAGGRYTYASPSATNAQAGLVIVGYRPAATFRIGAFADQSVNISTPNGFTQSKSSPMWGMFARWNLNKDGTGLGVQASAVSSSSKLTVTRPQLSNTETGSGNTQFDGQGVQLSTSYLQPVTDATAVVPYLGLRYTRVNTGGYIENATATVTSPLTYNAMAQNNFSAIAGVGVKSLLVEKLTGTVSVGIQQSLKYSMANYQGTSGITGLETFSVQMPGANSAMATATAGLSYAVAKNERLGFNVLWQQQPFINTNTTTALATYTIGF